jgi:hypothetical protein
MMDLIPLKCGVVVPKLGMIGAFMYRVNPCVITYKVTTSANIWRIGDASICRKPEETIHVPKSHLCLALFLLVLEK